MNRGYPPNAGRGRGFQPHYNPNMPGQSPQPYRSLPHQHMAGRGMPAPFQPQGGAMQQSPYRQNRSPAITPATMHQQAHLANPQAMPYYQGQPYQQPVRIPSSIQNSFSALESSKSACFSNAARSSQQSCQFPSSPLANLTELESRVPSGQSDPFLKARHSSFSSSTSDLDHYLTTLRQQNMYGMPPQGLDPYNQYYGGGYGGLQQSIHYPGHVPASPGRTHGFPQQMQAPYGVPYGQPPQAQGMSRTPSNMSERPSSAVPQPSTPAMTNVNHISHTHTPSVTAASPAPSSTFERPKKQSKAIIIKNGI